MTRYAAVIGVSILIAATSYAAYTLLGSQRQMSSMTDVAACASRRDFVECSRPHIRALLGETSAEDLIADVAALELPSNQCHYILHLIGQDLFSRIGSVEEAIRECTHACNSACPHGVIGEAFSAALDTGAGIELGHLSPEEIRAMGQDLCGPEPAGVLLSGAVKGTCHGAGHALFLAYQNLDRALDVCAEIAPAIQESACYRGVYMEYTDLLSARSTWQDEYTDLYEPTIEELSRLCVRDDIHESAACYYYLPIAVRQVYQKAGVTSTREDAAEKARDICVAAENALQRQVCLLGYGVTLYGAFVADQAAATRTCLALGRETDQEACIAGMISLVVEYGEHEAAVAYCSALTAASLRTLCYGAVFERLVTLVGRSVDDALPYCPLDQLICRDMAEEARRGAVARFFTQTDAE